MGAPRAESGRAWRASAPARRGGPSACFGPTPAAEGCARGQRKLPEILGVLPGTVGVPAAGGQGARAGRVKGGLGGPTIEGRSSMGAVGPYVSPTDWIFLTYGKSRVHSTCRARDAVRHLSMVYARGAGFRRSCAPTRLELLGPSAPPRLCHSAAGAHHGHEHGSYQHGRGCPTHGDPQGTSLDSRAAPRIVGASIGALGASNRRKIERSATSAWSAELGA